VAEGAQLAIGCQSRERLPLEDAVRRQVVEDAGLEAEEAAVDPVLAARLLDEPGHLVTGELGDSPLQVGADDGDRRERPMPMVEVE
jgi:hypothetical protein